VTCALELDEGVRPTGHPSAHVLPAALAAAEVVDASWPELLTAFTAGYEVAAGLFDALRLRAPAHPHGHLGAAGAAVAVALLTGDDPLEMARAAATIPLLTTWAPCLEGANVRNTWAGHAASAGLLARRLVRAGFRGSPSSYEAAFDGLVGDRVEVDPALVGTRITGGYVKLYSACAITHSAIEAALKLRPHVLADGALEAGAEIRVAVNANSLKTAAQPGATDLSRRFSIPYAVAVALLRGDADRARYDEPDPEALDLARRVTVVEDPAATAAWPRLAPATVTVGTDRSVRTAHVDDAYGHPGNPADATAVRAKFASLTGLGSDVWERLTAPAPALSVRAALDLLTG
jgi:2-methylcitrate dehydratase PrpD